MRLKAYATPGGIASIMLYLFRSTAGKSCLLLREHLGKVFRELARQRESSIEEGHMMPDHVHMLISIPPKYAVSQVVGYIKGKSAIHIARTFFGRKKNFVGQNFWARGYYVLN